MIRIGIIGTESSHAMAFAKYFNCPDPETGTLRYPDIRVVAVMGERQSAEEVQEKANVPSYYERVEDFLGNVDAVVITTPKGSKHLEQIRPFIDLGLPIFIDKPFTSSVEEAETLGNLLKDSKCKVTGGSGLKYAKGVEEYNTLVSKLRRERKLVGASMDFQTVLESEHDGLYFYTPHLIELLLEIFGPEVRSVTALQTDKNVTAVVAYDHETVSLHFVEDSMDTSCVLYTKEHNQYTVFDWSKIYSSLAENFVEMLRSDDWTSDIDRMIQSVRLINAIVSSLETGRTVYL